MDEAIAAGRQTTLPAALEDRTAAVLPVGDGSRPAARPVWQT